MRSLVLGFFLLTAVPFSAPASSYFCPTPSFTPAKDVDLGGKTVLIVTHVSTIWDFRQSAKAGLDRLVENAKARKVPVVYLQGDDQAKTYFYDDCKPDYYVRSGGGEFQFSFDATHVITAGGHFEYCQHTSIEQIFRVWQQKHAQDDLKLTEVGDAIYLYGNSYMNPAASYHEKFEWYRRVFDSEKISLADLFRIITDPQDQVDFVTKYLRTLNPPSTHRVVVKFNGSQKLVYRPGPISSAPTLTINFVTGRSNDQSVFGP